MSSTSNKVNMVTNARVIGPAPKRHRPFRPRRHKLTSHKLYPVGTNLCQFIGVVMTEPKPGNLHEVCWWRIEVPDLEQRKPDKRLLHLICMTDKPTIRDFVSDNVHTGQEMHVFGRLYTVNRPDQVDNHQGRSKVYTYLHVDRCDINLPEIPSRDPDYVHVRRDLWDRMVMACQHLDPLDSPVQPHADPDTMPDSEPKTQPET